MTTNYYATISDRIPDTEFPFRVFYYAPGMGFETGNAVYVGRHDCRTLEQAKTAADKYNGFHADRQLGQEAPEALINARNTLLS